MNIHYNTLKKTKLFQGIDAVNFDAMLACLNGRILHFNKNEFIISLEDEITHIGVVLQGSVHIIREEESGEQVILSELHEGSLFAESFVCAGIQYSPVAVLAHEHCDVLFINFSKVVSMCTTACSFHGKLVENMLQIIASKNIFLNNKMEILSKKTIQEKILAYLYLESKHRGKKEFDIPFSRDELADYLCVNRSALSRQLCAMRDQGLLTFHKNHFQLLS